ncbi:protein of unknown function DUF214 [Planctopirus limnophila DSM 3776]|uniref:ABC3 transporter permease C-terminal domain-containing protein n=1 Tax=Planctopirus limnophila (strain ATCC 43296 / DSM 3776 / IFAM 1008 / Mu 290) TaxID=521674 RepID=D5SPW9_PLAL2|nr:FtsX-like permease family protein [Planctopirus limnophila]ADG68344.1 protein of unknown function DUF214 [Planctopirus limnophila DSM 3776]
MYKLLLCQKYLRTRYIALASIISVMLGVATMIVVNSVMAGFSSEMRDRIKGLLSDVVIETNGYDGEKNPDAHAALVKKVVGEHIAGMTTTVEIYGMISFEYAGQWITRPVTLIGIDPQSKAEVGPLVDYLQSYRQEKEGDEVVREAERQANEPPGWSLTSSARNYRRDRAAQEAFFREQRLHDQRQRGAAVPENRKPAVDDSVVDPFAMEAQANGAAVPPAPVDPTEPLPGKLYIGAGLISFPFEDAETGKIRTQWMVRTGDDVKISTVTAGTPQPVYFNATVVDTFKSGMSEYDSSLVFCNLEYLQQVRGMVHPTTGERAITSIQLKLKDFRSAGEVVDKLRAAFPPGLYTIRTWEQKQGPLLAAVDVESSILNVLLFLIITVAGFGILAIFFMIVVEKTRDIGVLKALGASSTGVMSIFLLYGLSLGVVGSGGGVACGLLFVRYINQIELVITYITGRKVFDERIYYFPEIPTYIDPWMVVSVALGAMGIAVLASILPARRAARLQPVQALRSE